MRPPGRKTKLPTFWKEVQGLRFSVSRDTLGNVIGHKGKGRKVMIASRMDEISMASRASRKKAFLSS